MALNLTSEGLKYPPEVRVRHETCSTICGTPVQAILDQKNLTRLAGGVREGQGRSGKVRIWPRKWTQINWGEHFGVTHLAHLTHLGNLESSVKAGLQKFCEYPKLSG